LTRADGASAGATAVPPPSAVRSPSALRYRLCLRLDHTDDDADLQMEIDGNFLEKRGNVWNEKGKFYALEQPATPRENIASVEGRCQAEWKPIVAPGPRDGIRA